MQSLYLISVLKYDDIMKEWYPVDTIESAGFDAWEAWMHYKHSCKYNWQYKPESIKWIRPAPSRNCTFANEDWSPKITYK